MMVYLGGVLGNPLAPKSELLRVTKLGFSQGHLKGYQFCLLDIENHGPYSLKKILHEDPLIFEHK